MIRTWSGVQAQHAIDHVGEPFQPEPLGPAAQELEDPDAPLVQQAKRVERQPPDVDVRQVDDPHASPRCERIAAGRMRQKCNPTHPTSTS